MQIKKCQKIFKRNTIKRANKLNKQHCRKNTIDNISIYKNPISRNANTYING